MSKELQLLLPKAANGLCHLLPLRNPPGLACSGGAFFVLPHLDKGGRQPPQPCVRGAPSHPIRHLPLITSQEWRLLFSLPSQVALGCISSLVAGWSHLPPEKHSTPWHWQRRGEGNEKPQLWVAFSPQRDWTKSPTSSSLLQSWWSFRDQFQTGRGRTTF